MEKTSAELHVERLLQDPEIQVEFLLQSLAASLAAQVKSAREFNRFSQADLAKILETTQSQISRYENPLQARYSLQTLARLAVSLNCKIQINLVPTECSSVSVDFSVGGSRQTQNYKQPTNTVVHTFSLFEQAA